MKKIISSLLFLSFLSVAFAQSAKDLVKDGKKSLKTNEYETAIGKFTLAINADKAYGEAYLLRAETYVQVKKYEQAIADYKIACTHYDKKASVQSETARWLFHTGQYKDALTYATKATDIESSNLDGISLQYKSQYHLGNYAEAQKINEKALSIDDKKAEAHFYKGLIAFKQNKMPEAEASLVECAKLDGEFSGVYTALAEVRYERKVYDKVLPTADIAIKKNPKDDQAYLIKAAAQHQMGKTDDAVATISTMIDATDHQAEAYRIKGTYYVQKGDDLNAKKDFTMAIKLNPQFITALNDRAHLYERQGEVKLASNDYAAILAIQPTTDQEKRFILEAEQRIYELNKESDQPKVALISPEADDKNTLSVLSNQGVQQVKIQISDQSDIKRVTMDGKELTWEGSKRNPLVVFEADLSKLEHFRIEAEDIYLNRNSQTYHVKIKQLKPPVVKLTEPYASSNGETYVDKDVTDLFVEGAVSHTEKIKSIKVNGINASYLHDKLNPTFSAKVDVTNQSKLTIEVEDVYNTLTQKEYNLIRTEVSADNPMGKTWVVFIENSNYANFSSLEGPTKDINLIKSALAPYNISKIIHKRDMGKEEMAKFFAIELRDLIAKNRVNSLMVWYAGHGKFVNETGYWIPVDANRDEEYSYYNINTLRASMQSYDKVLVHNLVITDACESGPSFYLAMRDVPKERVCGDWEATQFRSAQVLSSAGYELAVDNSQFTKTFAAMLTHNPDNCIPIEKISNKVVEAVEQTGNQKPSLGKIKGLEDQNGTFFFIKKE